MLTIVDVNNKHTYKNSLNTFFLEVDNNLNAYFGLLKVIFNIGKCGVLEM